MGMTGIDNEIFIDDSSGVWIHHLKTPPKNTISANTSSKVAFSWKVPAFAPVAA